MPISEEQRQAIREYKARRSTISKGARAERAHPTGNDLFCGELPPSSRGGGRPDPNPTGPKTEYQTVGGRWEKYGPNNAERWIPDAPYIRPVEVAHEPSVPRVTISPRPW
jgi:hypothetical protein